MSSAPLDAVFAALDATWPAAAQFDCGGCTLRDGQGGGKRVSAATLAGPQSDVDLGRAAKAMRALGQTPLFQVRNDQRALDMRLEQAGYLRADPSVIYAAPARALATELPPRTVAIPAWEPLKIMEDIWSRGGIGPDRIEIMRRAPFPKTGLISRWQDSPAGTGFVARHQNIAMLHALEILPEYRGKGLGRWAVRRAAFWALANGAETLCVICTEANDAANGLYSSLGMDVIGSYHYRSLPEDPHDRHRHTNRT
ncbi:GNAT family N-acetyltransferase [Cognatishimia sp. SS12]|uniref:GNAT family N-acetyltransferase n=1 Tax=Cognatishimia sp. SS12 TaxID=2979465 RepID=UPI00232FA1DD|nr:GNAT family N-acetyltransferase [Cognatishimia sp. SS12]MDC0737597.1 GNAT family N-acetyltransferase [Cognatishimia sp. SS12]